MPRAEGWFLGVSARKAHYFLGSNTVAVCRKSNYPTLIPEQLAGRDTLVGPADNPNASILCGDCRRVEDRRAVERLEAEMAGVS